MILGHQQSIRAVFAPQSKAAPAAPAAPQAEVPGETFAQVIREDLGLMPKPQEALKEEANAVAVGGLYGGLAGAGVAAVLAAGTGVAVTLSAANFGVGLLNGTAAAFGVGLVACISTIPMGIVVGTMVGCGVEAFKQRNSQSTAIESH